MINLPVLTNMMLMLSMGHFLCDFGLQSDRMAQEKCPGRGVTLGWGWWLTAHAAIHGLMVAIITNIPALGLAEWILHIFIDIGKCRHLWRLPVDQSLHIGSKLIWAFLAVLLIDVPGWSR